ncbi:MAG TPA: hypothetical protein RMH99_07515 [Sandaracinaceae bacterium LLY-WYZ-13_1]|nr:hypothetical protein [Sandaracinaceae bacterium LLY-WYZ-13_1]
MTRLRYRFSLSDEEFRRAWLAEYYRRPGWRGLRILGGPAFVALGIVMVRSPELFTRVMGGVAILFGVYYAAKPWLMARALTRRRRASGRADVALELTLGPRGIRIDDGHVRTDLPWDEITAAGEGRGYVWYEIGGGSRATIPLRVVDDPDALRAWLRERTEWKG